MSTVNEKMTALADAIREKTGITDTLTLDEMATAVQGIETGGSGGGSVETCTVTINTTLYGTSDARIIAYTYTAIENGEVVVKWNKYLTSNMLASITLSDVVCGSVITVMLFGEQNMWEISGDVSVESFGSWYSSMAPIAILSAPAVAGCSKSIVFNNID